MKSITRGLTAVGFAFVVMAARSPEKNEVALLTSNDLDPVMVLPPPPLRDSAQAKAELAELHLEQATASTADRDAAEAEGKIKDASIFEETIPGFDLHKLPATARLFDLVRTSEKALVDLGKNEFKRPRPWIADPTIQSCSKGDDPLSSYPSGHTSSAFSMAGVLARLIPAHATAILARAARYGQTRIICEQHFRSDVSAGEALGLLIAERLMTKPVFIRQFDASRRELIAAGLLQP